MESRLNEKQRRMTSLTPRDYLRIPIALALYDNTKSIGTSHSIDPLQTTSLFVVAACSSAVTVIDNLRQQPAPSPGAHRLAEIGKHPIHTSYSGIHAICISDMLVYLVDMYSTEISLFSIEGDYVTTFQRSKSHFITDLAISPGGETAYFTDHQHDLIRITSSCAPLSATAGAGVLLSPDRISTTASGAVVVLCITGLYLFNETRDGLVYTRQLYRAENYVFSREIMSNAWPCFCCDPSQELVYLVTPTLMLTINLEGYILDSLHLERESQHFAYNVDVKVNKSGKFFFLNSYLNLIVTY